MKAKPTHKHEIFKWNDSMFQIFSLVDIGNGWGFSPTVFRKQIFKTAGEALNAITKQFPATLTKEVKFVS